MDAKNDNICIYMFRIVYNNLYNKIYTCTKYVRNSHTRNSFHNTLIIQISGTTSLIIETNDITLQLIMEIYIRWVRDSIERRERLLNMLVIVKFPSIINNKIKYLYTKDGFIYSTIIVFDKIFIYLYKPYLCRSQKNPIDSA